MSRSIERLAQRRVKSGGETLPSEPNPHLAPISDVLREVVERTRRLWDDGTVCTGIATGFSDLDEALDGLHPGTLTVVGGLDTAALGAFALALVLQVSTAQVPVLYCTTHSNRHDLGLRLLVASAKVSFGAAWRGRLTADEWTRLDGAAARLASIPLTILDHPGLTLDMLRGQIDSLAPSGVVIVDRLSHVLGDSAPPAVSARLGEVLAIAGDHGHALVALEATRWPSEDRPDRRPQISDLPTPDAWIDHASSVVLVHEETVFDAQSPDRGTVEINAAMNSFGPRGQIRLAHLEQYRILANMQRA